MPGHIDTNGVYIYAEDDGFDSTSDVLNTGQEATSDAIGLLRGRATTLETEQAKRVKIYTASGIGAIDALFPPPSTKAARIALQQEGNLVMLKGNGRYYQYWAEDDSDEPISENSIGRTPAGWYPTNDRQTGYFNGVSDDDGLCVIEHSLGALPYLFVTPLAASIASELCVYAEVERTLTTVTIRVTRADTGSVLGLNAIKFHWMAIVPDF